MHILKCVLYDLGDLKKIHEWLQYALGGLITSKSNLMSRRAVKTESNDPPQHEPEHPELWIKVT